MSKKKFKKVLVVLGGTSGERAISLASGRACIKALKSKRYKVSMINLKICFPEKSDDWLEKMASTSLGEFAKAILEAPYLWRVASKSIDKLI